MLPDLPRVDDDDDDQGWLWAGQHQAGPGSAQHWAAAGWDQCEPRQGKVVFPSVRMK